MSLDDFPELIKLTTKEKILLIEELWDSIQPDDSTIPVPESHKRELNQRIATLKTENLLTMDELKKRVDSRK